MKQIFQLVMAASLLLMASCDHAPADKEKAVVKPLVDTAVNEKDDWALIPFSKVDSINPILKPDTSYFFSYIQKKLVRWEEKDVFNPAIVVRNGKVFMLYRAQDNIGRPAGTSRIGLAESKDGFHFRRYHQPVLFPEDDEFKIYEWEGGCEDPRVVEDEEGDYIMTYTAFDGTTARLMVAVSNDLTHWTKKGPAFAKAFGGKYADKWTKSGSIVCRYTKDKAVAVKINGSYWMYWGDQNIWAARSDDLINWSPVEMSDSETPPVNLKGEAQSMPNLKIVVAPRNGRFDSDLVEPGPPAMLTTEGIVLMYNGRNTRSNGDSSLPEGCYAAGQVLLDKNNPLKLLERLDHYFLKPDKPYEVEGQVDQVCFVEGLTWFNGNWLLYYGTADSRIAMAQYTGLVDNRTFMPK